MNEGENDYVENDSWEHFFTEVRFKLENLNGRLGNFEQNFTIWVEEVLKGNESKILGNFQEKGLEMVLNKQMEFVGFYNAEITKMKVEMSEQLEQAKTHFQAGFTHTQGVGWQISDVERVFQTKWVELERNVRGFVDMAVGNVEARILDFEEGMKKFSASNQSVSNLQGQVEKFDGGRDKMVE